MSEIESGTGPILADPVVLPRSPMHAGFIPAGIAAGGLLFAACWALLPDMPPADRYIPRGQADLGSGVVTPVDAGSPAALRAAVGALNLPERQRRDVERDVLAGRRRIGWVVVVDSMDPDGDVVAVEGAGIAQSVTLTKGWTPVPVLLDDTHRIGITALRDGGGGGVTVALATAGSPVTLRRMTVGERVEVATP